MFLQSNQRELFASLTKVNFVAPLEYISRLGQLLMAARELSGAAHDALTRGDTSDSERRNALVSEPVKELARFLIDCKQIVPQTSFNEESSFNPADDPMGEQVNVLRRRAREITDLRGGLLRGVLALPSAERTPIAPDGYWKLQELVASLHNHDAEVHGTTR